MIEIEIPLDLMGKNSINFCKSLDGLDDDDTEYKIKFRAELARGTYEPFGMLVAGAKICEFKSRVKQKGANIRFSYYDLNDYVGHMGFYRSIGLGQGKRPGEASGSSTYIPITCIKTADVREESKSKLQEVGRTIEFKIKGISFNSIKGQ